MRAMAGTAQSLGGHLVGGSSGHHGLKLLVLVLLVAALTVVAVVLVRRSRARRRAVPSSTTVLPARSEPPTPDGAGHRGTEGRGARGRVGPAGHAIKADGLTKRYGEKIAVDGLTFSVEPGRVTGFLGPNGAGKSTTMRLVMGLDKPDQGSVTVNGRKYHELVWPLREVGALLEAKAMHPGRSAYAHLWMLAKTNRIPRRRVDEVLGLVGLSSVAGQLVGGFSLGMTQRLGIAAAMLGDPGILLFDEPVNGLDTDGIRWVRQFLRQLATEGRAVFVSSHLMAEMAQTADVLVVVAKGRLVADMAVSEFTAHFARGFVRVRTPQLEELRAALEEAGATVERDQRSIAVRGMSEDAIGEIAWRSSILLQELSPQAASLEDAFIESTEYLTEFGGSLPASPHHTTEEEA